MKALDNVAQRGGEQAGKVSVRLCNYILADYEARGVFPWLRAEEARPSDKWLVFDVPKRLAHAILEDADEQRHAHIGDGRQRFPRYRALAVRLIDAFGGWSVVMQARAATHPAGSATEWQGRQHEQRESVAPRRRLASNVICMFDKDRPAVAQPMPHGTHRRDVVPAVAAWR